MADQGQLAASQYIPPMAGSTDIGESIFAVPKLVSTTENKDDAGILTNAWNWYKDFESKAFSTVFGLSDSKTETSDNKSASSPVSFGLVTVLVGLGAFIWLRRRTN